MIVLGSIYLYDADKNESLKKVEKVKQQNRPKPQDTLEKGEDSESLDQADQLEKPKESDQLEDKKKVASEPKNIPKDINMEASINKLSDLIHKEDDDDDHGEDTDGINPDLVTDSEITELDSSNNLVLGIDSFINYDYLLSDQLEFDKLLKSITVNELTNITDQSQISISFKTLQNIKNTIWYLLDENFSLFEK